MQQVEQAQKKQIPCSHKDIHAHLFLLYLNEKLTKMRFIYKKKYSPNYSVIAGTAQPIDGQTKNIQMAPVDVLHI